MSCTIEQNLLVNCAKEYPTAGAGKVYLIPINKLDESGITSTSGKHDVATITVKDAEKWSILEGKIDMTGLATENSKDGGGKNYEPTITLYAPEQTAERADILEKYANYRLVVIIELNEREGANRKAQIIGYDFKKGVGAGAELTFNSVIEQESGGKNGYDVEIKAIQAESPRFVNASIVAEDGSTGETIKFGTAV